MSRTFKGRSNQKWARSRREDFRCRHCGAYVGAVPCGAGGHRNHCPYCLYSRHVDGETPGDRASTCGGSMAPVGYFTRRKGEHVVVHRCLTCGFDRYNRIAGDDDFDLLMALPELAPPARLSRPGRIELNLTA